MTDLHLHEAERRELPGHDLPPIGDTYDRLTPGADVVVVGALEGGPKMALGNHEHWDRRRIPLREGLKALAGVHVLRDWVQVGGLRRAGSARRP